MPYQRTPLFDSESLSWQELRLLDANPGWSDAYLPPAPRLLVPMDGCFECGLAGQRFTCDAASALWLTPASTYRMRQATAAQRSLLLVLKGGELGAPRRVALGPPQRLALAYLRRAASAGRADRIDALALEENLLGLVQRALAAEPLPRERRPHAAVERARAYIASDPTRRDGLAQIAAAAFASPFHLARRFRAETGDSLHAFRNRLRLSLALERLRQGEADLSALALDLGFSHHSHFSMAFKRCFGIPPRTLRRNLTAIART